MTTTRTVPPAVLGRLLGALREIERITRVDNAGLLVCAILASRGALALAPEVQAALTSTLRVELAARARHACVVGVEGQSGTRVLYVYRRGSPEPAVFSASEVARICGDWPRTLFHLTLN